MMMFTNYLKCIVFAILGSLLVMNYSVCAQDTAPAPHKMSSLQATAPQEGIMAKLQANTLPLAEFNKTATATFESKLFNGSFFTENGDSRNSAYDYLEHLGTGMNVPLAAVTDTTGNTYITGTTSVAESPQGNFLLVKLDPNGDVSWTFEQPSTAFAASYGVAITLDNSENPVVSGVVWNGNDMDAYTVKVEKDSGMEMWSHIFDNGQNGFDVPTSVIVKPSGETVVAGITYASDAVVYLVLQYNTFGNLDWSHTDTDVIPQSWNEPLSLAVHTNGTIAVTGFGAVSGSSSGYYEGYITALYDDSGQQLWRDDYLFERLSNESDPNSPLIPTHSIGRSVAFDSSGNVYVTGTFDASSFSRIGTIKYMANGTEDWVNTYRGGSDNDHLTDGQHIKISTADTIYIGGRHRMGWVDEGTVLLSYDTNGNENWTAEATDIIQIQDSKLILNSDELPVIAGIGYDDGTFDTLFKVRQYDANGNEEASISYVKQESNFEGFRRFIDLHAVPGNQVILTLNYEYTEKGGVFETVNLPWNSGDNNPNWVSIYEKPLSRSNTRMLHSVADSQNNSYVAGDYGLIENLTYYRTYFVAKYDENGNVAWEVPFNALNGNETNGIVIRTNSNDEVIVFLVPGNYDETPLRIKKYSSDGALLWETEEMVYESFLTTFYIDPNNHIIVGGSGKESATGFDRKFIAMRFSDSGDTLWTRYDTTDDPNDFIFEINDGIADAEGNIYFTGTSGTATMLSEDVDATVLKYSPSGDLLWISKYPQNDFIGAGLKLLQNQANDLFVVGVRQETVDLIEEMLVLKIDSEGDLLWEMDYGQSNIGRRIKPYTAFFNSAQDLVIPSYSLYWVPGEPTNNRITAIRVSSLDGNVMWEHHTEINRYYGDAYIDGDDKLYIWNQAGVSALPETIIGGFSDAELTVIEDTGTAEDISFTAPGMALFTAASINALNNGKLIMGGHVFDEFALFSGLYFFEYTHTPLSQQDFEIPGSNPGHQLGQNYPNPVSTTTEIPFYLTQPEQVVITIYDYQGRIIKELANTPYTAGHHTLSFDKGSLQSGLYFYGIQAGAFSQARKMIVK